MRVLALDCSSKTGWAFHDGENLVDSGVKAFDVKRGESAGMRFVRFRAWLGSLMDSLRPDVVIYEQAHHRGGAATELCVGLVTRVIELASERGLNYMSVHSSSLKKIVCGNGKASKSDIMQVVEREFCTKIIDDNHGDALALIMAAKKTI